jgi:peptidyl-prolyl cis-trans isomerase A (cyclophilin A)
MRMTDRAFRLASIAAACTSLAACTSRERASTPAANPASSVPPAAAPAVSLPNETAPATYRARFETSAGPFVIEVHRDWAPQGADRFYNLVKSGYYDGVRFFRVIGGFMAQFGIHGDPKVAAQWHDADIPDDPVRQSNTPGMVTFATAGPNTRTTQVFINFGNNSALDKTGFAPFGRVVGGMPVVNRLYAGYGEGAPEGHGPEQGRIESEGNAYLERQFPKLDFVRRATIVARDSTGAAHVH